MQRNNLAVLTQSHKAIASKRRKRDSQIKEIIFDEDARREFLTGFHKRKVAKKEEAKKHAKVREKQERQELRREHRRALAERAAQNAAEIEKAYGAVIGVGGDEWGGITDESVAIGEEYEGEEQLATVTVVEDFDLFALHEIPENVETAHRDFSTSPPLPHKGKGKEKPTTNETSTKRLKRSTHVRYQTKAARAAERAKQRTRHSEKAEQHQHRCTPKTYTYIAAGCTMNSLYTLGIRQTNSLTADLERLKNGDNSASLLGQISASLAAMNRTIEDYEAMTKREIIKAKQEKGQMRVQKFRADYAELKGQFEKLRNEKLATQRNELLQGPPSSIQSPGGSDARRRFTSGHFNGDGESSQHAESPFRMPAPLPNQTLREHHALNEHSFIQSTDIRLDEFIAQGREVLDNLVDQRNVLKGTQKRLLDAANTLGLSREVIGWIERRRTRRRSEEAVSVGSIGGDRGKRRMSTDGRVSQESSGSAEGSETGEEGEEEGMSTGRGRRIKRSLSPTLNRSSVFENIAHLFGRAAGDNSGRRQSLSIHSSVSSTRRSRCSRLSDGGSEHSLETDSADERWGYSSGEEDDSTESLFPRPPSGIASDVEYGSYPPSPGPSTHLPLLAPDPIFGDEVRIDIDTPLEPLDPPPPGPPSRQRIYAADEDSTLLFVGYEIILWRQRVWRLCSVLTLGVLALFGHWFPRLWLHWVLSEKAFKDLKHGFVVVESAYRDITLFPIKHLPYPYERSSVFPNVSPDIEGLPRNTQIPKANSYDNDGSDIIGDLLIVDYRYSRFVLDPNTGLFSTLRDWRDPSWSNIHSVQHGPPQRTRRQRQTLFGSNLVDIEGKSTISLLLDEAIHPFYVFQVASIVLWSLDDYYYYAFCIALISTLSIVTTLIDTKKTIKRMRDMSRFSCDAVVYTDGRWDIVNLSELRAPLFPADIFLLSGDAIVNESMLTGESVPVAKVPVKDSDLARWQNMKDVEGPLSKNFLYAGTRIVRIRGALGMDGIGGGPALGLVARTGFNTTKGALVRSMLFPKPIGFKFYHDSIRFIGVLAGIAGLGFCASAVQFIRLNIPWTTIIVRALDLVTVVVPPALPATLSIGTSFAIGRLRKQGIFCISPTRVNVSGKVNVCCFDKTGTLTEDGLDILGVRSLDRTEHRFGELIDNVHDLPSTHDRASFLHALATCHSLKMVDGEAIGDPLDAKMFEFTKWTLEEGLISGTGIIKGKSGAERPAALVQTVVRPPGSARFRLEDALKSNGKHAHFLELGVIRTFEFVSVLRRMSVVVKRLKSSSMEIYVKGAPEVMAEICEKDSFPQDYDDLLSYYTRRGYRVIAIAGKSIDGLSWLKAQKMKREQAESNLRFLGLVIFENKVKPGTTAAIQTLRGAHLTCRMITGDNPLTAVSVARECTLINPAAHVFCPTFIQGDANTPLSRLEWSCMDDYSWKLDPYGLKPLTPPPHHTVEEGLIEYQDYALVVTGDVFRWIIQYAPLETLQRMLVKTQVFARMSPDEKNEVVERLQALGYTVLMCGDGANDCAALKAADVGISLSEAEASVAAPFTSSTPDIGCVIEVIKEGRAALATSFSCFKYIGEDTPLPENLSETSHFQSHLEESAH
ncbi:hypothetical protein ID866_522 [Astraeus odoratus]|nr:hypothetical protein ID866_522 [Astraeus odoratus]